MEKTFSLALNPLKILGFNTPVKRAIQKHENIELEDSHFPLESRTQLSYVVT